MSTWHGLKNFNKDGEYIGPYIPNERDIEDQRIEILELLRNAGNRELETKTTTVSRLPGRRTPPTSKPSQPPTSRKEMSTWHGLKNFNKDGEYIGPYIPNERDIEDQRIEILELLRNAGNRELETK
uniref:Uncharacterized protein n=1 Tax=Anopheles arabiensis TaxID=7173 RepID=A0A182IHS9_ANOAR